MNTTRKAVKLGLAAMLGVMWFTMPAQAGDRGRRVRERDRRPERRVREPDRRPDRRVREPDRRPDRRVREPDRRPDRRVREPDRRPDRRVREPDRRPDRHGRSTRSNSGVGYVTVHTGRRYGGVGFVASWGGPACGRHHTGGRVCSLCRLYRHDGRDAYEDDDKRDRARRIVLGHGQTHTIHEEDDEDWLIFYPPEYGLYAVRLRGVTVPLKCEVWAGLYGGKEKRLRKKIKIDRAGGTLLLAATDDVRYFKIKVQAEDDDDTGSYFVRIVPADG